jgi:organic radical activating enzyme
MEENKMPACLIDIIDKCNLRCPTCARGTRLIKNSQKSMSIDLFKKIVEKAKEEGYDCISIFNWTEPFLAKNLPDYVSAVKAFGLNCNVSSNLSLNPRKYFDTIERTLRAGIDHLTVSVSGYSQAVYEINHIGGTLSWVKENLERIGQLSREGIIGARIVLRLIEFDYNVREGQVLKDYANSLGVEFEVIEGSGHPNNPVTSQVAEENFLNRLKYFTCSSIYEKNGEICSLIPETVSIDSEGDVYLCCANPNYSCLRIGPYLEKSKEDLLLRRYTHPICLSCGFPRRKATETDFRLLVGAIKYRLGNPKLQDEHTQYIESLLKEKEMTLNNIYRSRGWKALLIYYRVRDKIFSVNTSKVS